MSYNYKIQNNSALVKPLNSLQLIAIVCQYLLREPLVQLLLGVQHESLPLGSLLALSHQCGQLVAFEQPRHLPVSQQSVHTLQEAGVQHVGLVHDETDLLTLSKKQHHFYSHTNLL